MMSLLFYMFKFTDISQDQTIDIQTFADSDHENIIDQVVHYYGDLYEKFGSIAGRNIEIETLSGTELSGDTEQGTKKLNDEERDALTKDLNDQVQELLDRIEQDLDQGDEN